MSEHLGVSTSERRQVNIDFCFNHFLLEDRFLDKLQELLVEVAVDLNPWSLEEEVEINLKETGSLREKIQTEVKKPPSAFYQTLVEATGHTQDPRCCDTLELWSRDNSVCIVIGIDERIMTRAAETWMWGNTIDFQVLRTVCGKTQSEWACEAFREGCRLLKPTYGNAKDRKEQEGKNMKLEGGVQAIGVNWANAIPGLYWLNFFGRPFIEMFGRDSLPSAPAHEVCEVNQDGVLLRLGESPFDWGSDEYRATESRVLDHLGRQYFFNREEPDRETVIAPEIASLIENSPAGPFDPSKPSVLHIELDSLE